jgi:predicted regulator of Ras-like GTPase activity (Roadblock/LC7/MglB family)
VASAVADEGIDRYLLDDVDDEMLDETDDEAVTPIIVPEVVQSATSAAEPVPATVNVTPPEAITESRAEALRPESAMAKPVVPSRESRLADALEQLMQESVDVEASALVSLDGFIIASALPQGMQEDRVGAMSAAILALGERAAAELGRGQLTQVFIEGAEGYVLLVAAGGRAVLTVLARKEAKLGLVLYDMREAADTIAEILR